MLKHEDVAAGTLAAITTYLIGGIDNMVQLMAILMLFNFLTGCLSALKQGGLKNWDGDKILWGAAKMLVFLMVIIAANRVDQLKDNPQHTLRQVVLIITNGYYGQSFLKNCKKLGLPIPQAAFDYIKNVTKGIKF